jgi:hypothetical protein
VEDVQYSLSWVSDVDGPELIGKQDIARISELVKETTTARTSEAAVVPAEHAHEETERGLVRPIQQVLRTLLRLHPDVTKVPMNLGAGVLARRKRARARPQSSPTTCTPGREGSLKFGSRDTMPAGVAT